MVHRRHDLGFSGNRILLKSALVERLSWLPLRNSCMKAVSLAKQGQSNNHQDVK